MSSPKVFFSKGIAAFQAGKYQEALLCFTEALSQEGQKEQQLQLYYSIYDSRAATYEKLNRPRDALHDVKRAIQLGQSRWQAYARGARLLAQTQRYDAAIGMADRALAKIDAELELGVDASKKASATANLGRRRAELESIKASALRNLSKNGTPNKVKEKRRHSDADSSPRSSYISSLPIELLTEIFSLVIANDHTALARMILRVCQDWRRVAWSCPALWNTLVLGDAKISPRHGPRKKAGVWLARSAGHIRDLRVHARAVEHSDWLMSLEAELTLLKWHGLRRLTIERWDLGKYLKSASLERSLESLYKLEIVDAVGSSTPRESLLSPACHLTELSLERVQLSFDSIFSRSLRHVTLNNCYHGQEHIFKILELQPLLETFTARELPAKFIRRWQFAGPLNLNHLTHIDLTMCFLPPVERLHVPNLRVLRISQSGFPLDGAFVHLASLNLTNFDELSLSQVPCQPRPLVTFLRTVPTLTTLRLTSNENLASEVVEALANPVQRNTDLLCPQLQHADVSQSPDIKSATLVRLVRSRILDSQDDVTVSKIHTLKMDGCHGVEADLLPWFRERVPEVSCIYLSKKEAAWRR